MLFNHHYLCLHAGHVAGSWCCWVLLGLIGSLGAWNAVEDSCDTPAVCDATDGVTVPSVLPCVCDSGAVCTAGQACTAAAGAGTCAAPPPGRAEAGRDNVVSGKLGFGMVLGPLALLLVVAWSCWIM